MKKLINTPGSVVEDALRGFAAAHPELRVDAEQRVVSRPQPSAGAVGLVSGGGSGHEPLHVGYVGPGMLTAAAPGDVYTAPGPGQALAARAVADSGAGGGHIGTHCTGAV